MHMKKKLYNLAQYSDQFIALSANDEILAADSSMKKLEEKLINNKSKDITIRYISPVDKYLSPTCH